MQDSVTVEVSFPYWTAYRAALEIILHSPFQLVVSALFPLGGMYLIYLWISHHHSVSPTDVLLVIVCFAFTPLITAMSLFLARRRNPLSKGPFKYTFDNVGIHASGEAFSMNVNWSAINKVRESRRFMFFFFAPARAHCIPLQQLSNGLVKSMLAIARTHVKDVAVNNLFNPDGPDGPPS